MRQLNEIDRVSLLLIFKKITRPAEPYLVVRKVIRNVLVERNILIDAFVNSFHVMHVFLILTDNL